MLIIVLKILIPFLIIFNLIPLLVWLERKGCAFIQDRHGPNRARLFGIRMGGLLHSLTDVIKLMTKEDIIPAMVNKPFYLMAPFLALAIACMTYIVIPFAHPLEVNGRIFTLQSADIDVGILYILAMSSLAVFAVMLAGWSSNNKYSLLGGVRASAQMFSYELSMGLSILSVLLLSGSLELGAIVVNQTEKPWNWNFLRLLPACVLFTVSAFAETNRSPFDLPEGESEIVAGYHTEYSSMKFGMFFMAEYAHIIVASALISTLFFGGWQVPFITTQFLRENAETGLFIFIMGHGITFMVIGAFLLSKFRQGRYGDARDYEVLIFGIPLILLGLGISVFTMVLGVPHLESLGQQIFAAVIQFGMFMVKILIFCWFFIWVRWTLPRFRYDQLMHLGWKMMLPTALVWVVVVAVAMQVK